MLLRPIRAATLAAALVLPALAQADGPNVETVLARVGGVEITLGHMVLLYERLPAQMRDRPDAELFDDMLRQLIEQTAIAETGAAMTRREEMFLELSRREYLTNSRLTEIAEGALTEDAIETAYAARFVPDTPQMEYNAAHILVQTLDEAQDLRADLEDGADFAEMARTHSLDPGSGAAGGDLGWFGTGRMVAPFEEAVVALEPGDISDPVETQFGWHLITLKDLRVAEAPPLEAVRPDLEREVQLTAILAAIEAAREGADVERFDEGIDRSLMRDQTLFEQ